jgi:hypothetical protein
MMRRSRVLSVLVILGVGAMVAAGVASSFASGPSGKKPLRFSTARILFELNSTDQDAGIQMLIDGEGWEHATVYRPDGKRIMAVTGRGSVGNLGITELFFESEEPSLAEVPLRKLLKKFPEGRYRIEGRTVDGKAIVGAAALSHVIPAGPEVTTPAEGEITDPDHTVIDWDPVVEPAGIEIRGYQVIVELPKPLRNFSVDLPATVTAVTVPAEFLEPGTGYKFEVLAVARNRNQTITEATFSTGP